MFVRGSGAGVEYKRIDNSFYKGIVVKNNDPEKLNRVKVYIPELSNQPFDDWFDDYDNINIKSMGTNINTKWNEKKTNGDWTDANIYEEISLTIPWAEQCMPLFGEANNFRYYKDGKISTISDCNYPEGFRVIDSSPPSIDTGSFPPAFLYENMGTRLGDAFSNPINNYTVKCNPYAFSYAPSKFANKAKGIFGIPEIGSKVWVFHYEGDLNFPIVFGTYNDYRSMTLINDTDNGESLGYKCPVDFEG